MLPPLQLAGMLKHPTLVRGKSRGALEASVGIVSSSALAFIVAMAIASASTAASSTVVSRALRLLYRS